MEWQVGGIVDLRGFLRELNPASQDRIILAALQSAGKETVGEARARVAVGGTGALRRSLGVVTRKSRLPGIDGKVLVAYVGARRGQYVQGRRLKKGEDARKSDRTPAKYSHLVERGFRRKNGDYQPGRPFLEPAFDATKIKATHLIATQGFDRALAAELRRAERRYNRAMSRLRPS